MHIPNRTAARKRSRRYCINNRLQNIIPSFTYSRWIPDIVNMEIHPLMTDSPFNLLDLDATLADIPGYTVALHPDYDGQHAFDVFVSQTTLPGILVQDHDKLLGMISRRIFFERTGKRFGTEVYLKRSLGFFITQDIPAPLVMSSKKRLSEAARNVLARAEADVYEPIVEEDPRTNYRIINPLTLFAAQNQILVNLHNAQLNDGQQSEHIDDDQAIARFTRLTGSETIWLPEMLHRDYRVQCPSCGMELKYTLADIVRSHPQIRTGIEVIERMGTTSYIFNLRHTCGNHLVEIPLVHDRLLEYRSMKPYRLVDTYV
jgi:hypothetical protein